MSEKVFSSGVRTKYAYNDMGVLSELTHSDKDGVLDRYSYTYDNMVNKTGIEKHRRGLEEESGRYSFTYDSLSRLTEVQKDGEQMKTFGYDEFGNRSFMTDIRGKTSYTYNALNQLISTVDTAIEQRYSYDRRGNLTQILENGKMKNTYEFGAFNRLSKATNADGNTAIYDYNGLGFRVGKQTADNLNPTKHISYVLDLTKQYHNLLQMSDETQTQSYTWDDHVAFADGNAYLQDELGSPLRYVDRTGKTIDSYGYDVFGDDLYGNQGVAQPFGFTGYTADSIAGTYFAQAREYMPHNGRFAGEDAAKYGSNWYAYCSSNPLNFVDPLGLCEWSPEKEQELRIDRMIEYFSVAGVRSLTNAYVTNIMRDLFGSAQHVPATLTDLRTGLSFNIIMARPGRYHSDWSPATEQDTNIIKQILHPGRDVNCESWRNHQTWPNFAAFPGVLTIGEHNIATGFNLTPHGNIMPGAYPGPTMPNAGRRPGGGWFVGGHMCLYFRDSTGGTPGAQAMEQYAFNFFNR